MKRTGSGDVCISWIEGQRNVAVQWWGHWRAKYEQDYDRGWWKSCGVVESTPDEIEERNHCRTSQDEKWITPKVGLSHMMAIIGIGLTAHYQLSWHRASQTCVFANFRKMKNRQYRSVILFLILEGKSRCDVSPSMLTVKNVFNEIHCGRTSVFDESSQGGLPRSGIGRSLMEGARNIWGSRHLQDHVNHYPGWNNAHLRVLVEMQLAGVSVSFFSLSTKQVSTAAHQRPRDSRNVYPTNLLRRRQSLFYRPVR